MNLEFISAESSYVAPLCLMTREEANLFMLFIFHSLRETSQHGFIKWLVS